MFDTRALQLEVVRGNGKPLGDRVQAHIYADDDFSPVVQAFAIPLDRVVITVKPEFGSPYCSENIGLSELLELLKSKEANDER